MKAFLIPSGSRPKLGAMKSISLPVGLRLVAVVAVLVLVIGGAWLARFLASSPLERAASRFDDEDRIRYRAALEKLRYDLRSAPGSPPFETVMNRDGLLAAIAIEDKKARLLWEKCGIEVTEEMVQAEYERIKDDPGDLRALAAITNSLDRDPAAMVEFWLRPTLVDRYLRACIAMDDEWNSAARSRIDRLRAEASGGDRSAESEIITHLSEIGLEPEDREALASTGPGQASGVIESPGDFHFFLVDERTGDTVRAGLVSAPKPSLEEWLKTAP